MMCLCFLFVFFCKHKTAYEMRISDWSSDVCSSDLQHAAGKLDDAALRQVEDDCIRAVVKRQEDAGLQGITDGEFRRTFFHVDFLERLAGVTVTYGEFTAAFRRDDGRERSEEHPSELQSLMRTP